MSTDQLSGEVTYLAGSDLSASQFCAVNLNSSGQLVLPTAGGRIVGVLYDKPSAAGAAAAVQTGAGRVVKWKLGGTVAKGDSVKVDTSGRIVTASAADVAAGLECGICVHSGAVNEIGSAQLTGRGLVSSTGAETVTSSGAVSIATEVTYLDVSGTKAYTLADGTRVGQRKGVECIGAAATPLGTLTIADAYSTEPTTYVFTAVGQRVDFEWTSTGWKIYRIRQAGVEAIAANATFNRLCRTQIVDVVGTKAYILAAGLVSGQKATTICTAASSAPAGTVTGSFRKLDGVASASFTDFGAAADAVESEWDGAAWQVMRAVAVTFA